MKEWPGEDCVSFDVEGSIGGVGKRSDLLGVLLLLLLLLLIVTPLSLLLLLLLLFLLSAVDKG